MEDHLSQAQFIEFRAGLAENMRDISERLLAIEQVVNGFKWREHIIGGFALFLFGIVSSLAVTTFDKRELITIMQERQNAIIVKLTEVEKKVTELDKQIILLQNKIERNP